MYACRYYVRAAPTFVQGSFSWFCCQFVCGYDVCRMRPRGYVHGWTIEHQSKLLSHRVRHWTPTPMRTMGKTLPSARRARDGQPVMGRPVIVRQSTLHSQIRSPRFVPNAGSSGARCAGPDTNDGRRWNGPTSPGESCVARSIHGESKVQSPGRVDPTSTARSIGLINGREGKRGDIMIHPTATPSVLEKDRHRVMR